MRIWNLFIEYFTMFCFYGGVFVCLMSLLFIINETFNKIKRRKHHKSDTVKNKVDYSYLNDADYYGE